MLIWIVVLVLVHHDYDSSPSLIRGVKPMVHFYEVNGL